MAGSNYILGSGEKLVHRVEKKSTGGTKLVYSAGENKRYLSERLRKVATVINQLPEIGCPGGDAVFKLVLHPNYTAKSYFPAALLSFYGLRSVGSKSVRIIPRKQGRKGYAKDEERETVEIFIAGNRVNILNMASSFGDGLQTESQLDSLRRVEDFQSLGTERLKALPENQSEFVLEAVLHDEEQGEEGDFVLNGLRDFCDKYDILGDWNQTFHAGGLCFLPIKADRAKAQQLLEFSFLRVARPMPVLRLGEPFELPTIARASGSVELPLDGPTDSSVKAAVFDGGLPENPNLSKWCSSRAAPGVGPSVEFYERHGLAVTSALLFGALEEGNRAPRPFGHVDHWRVLDERTATEDPSELFVVLRRIMTVLAQANYGFINLSIGPDIPVDDDEPHVWTCVLDQFLSDGKALATVAVGNKGHLDYASGNARVQPPSDSVNALSVGAANSPGPLWDRAPYSCRGPGRFPGVMKPDVLSFGGSPSYPFGVLAADANATITTVQGTSFASPATLRNALGFRAHFGDAIQATAAKVLLVHNADQGGFDPIEVGYGRVGSEIDEFLTSRDSEIHILYQGEMTPGQYWRFPIPVPAEGMQGLVQLRATFGYMTTVDPQDPSSYTRAGLEPTFYPHMDTKTVVDKKTGKAREQYTSFALFGSKNLEHLPEEERRRDGFKWETIRRGEHKFQGPKLREPTIDVRYVARDHGGASRLPEKIHYALVVTMRAQKERKLYDRVYTRYRNILQPIKPQIQLPVRFGRG